MLAQRGHASLAIIDLGRDAAAAFASLPAPLAEARVHPEWSRIGPEAHQSFEDDAHLKAILKDAQGIVDSALGA